MIKFLKRIPWKDVLVTVLVVALGVGAVVGVGAAITNKQKTVSPLVFERGGVDENGEHIKSTQSIYTKDYIECQGLEITPDFEATGMYQVFYYDANKLFLGSTPVMDAHSTLTYKKGSDFPYAMYARIVITPEVPKDDDGYVDEDYKVKFYEVAGIANKYSIKVNKQQKNLGLPNLMDLESTLVLENLVAAVNDDNFFVEQSLEGFGYCTIYLDNIRSLKVEFDKTADSYSYFFFDSSSQCVGVDKLMGGTEFIIDNIPERAKLICIIYKLDNVPVVYRAG